MKLTDDILHRIMTLCPAAKRAEYLPFIESAMIEFDITNELRAAAFLAQLAHESGELKYMEEIASGSAYEGRKDLGNTQPGDGKRFKGRGPIQLTGRANYKKFGDLLGLDLISNPTIAATKEVGFRIAGLYWQSKKLNALADKREFTKITKAINGGLNGEADRLMYYARALKVLPDDFDLDEADEPSAVAPEPIVAPDKGVTTGETEPAKPTEGSPPPVPAAEVKASQVSLFTKLSSLSLPAGAITVLGAVANFVKGLPPYVWVALALVATVVTVIGYLMWRDSKQQAHERTKILMSAAASTEQNNLRLV